MNFAMAVVIREDKVLIQRRNRNGNRIHEFPGGKVDQSEDFMTAAARELREETGLDLRPREYYTHRSHSGGTTAFVIFDMDDNQVPRITNPARNQEFFWLDIMAIPVHEFHRADRAFMHNTLNRLLGSIASVVPYPDAMQKGA
jgi:8-oxo-dGTP pyrophosphatase MutT (NUDIX family)